jgi:hypothetical protein
MENKQQAVIFFMEAYFYRGYFTLMLKVVHWLIGMNKQNIVCGSYDNPRVS